MRTSFFALAIFCLSAVVVRAETPAAGPCDPCSLACPSLALDLRQGAAATPNQSEAPQAAPEQTADIPGWFWTYVPDVVWSDWREIIT